MEEQQQGPGLPLLTWLFGGGALSAADAGATGAAGAAAPAGPPGADNAAALPRELVDDILSRLTPTDRKHLRLVSRRARAGFDARTQRVSARGAAQITCFAAAAAAAPPRFPSLSRLDLHAAPQDYESPNEGSPLNQVAVPALRSLSLTEPTTFDRRPPPTLGPACMRALLAAPGVAQSLAALTIAGPWCEADATAAEISRLPLPALRCLFFDMDGATPAALLQIAGAAWATQLRALSWTHGLGNGGGPDLQAACSVLAALPLSLTSFELEVPHSSGAGCAEHVLLTDAQRALDGAQWLAGASKRVVICLPAPGRRGGRTALLLQYCAGQGSSPVSAVH